MIDTLEPRQLFAGGLVDSTWGTAGQLFLPESAATAATVALPDGRVLVAEGGDRDVPQPSGIITLKMLLPANGAPDTSFGGRDGAAPGTVAVDLHRYDVGINKMVLTGDGKIVLAGRTSVEEDIGQE